MSKFIILLACTAFYVFMLSESVYSKDTSSVKAASEMIMSKWKENEDNKFEKVSESGRFIIGKKYLNKLWVSVFPDSSYKQVFYIYDDNSKQRKDFFELTQNDSVRFLDVDELENLLRIISVKNEVELFIHTIDSKKGVSLKKIDVDLKVIKKAVFVEGVVYILSSERFSDKLIRYNLLNNKSETVVDKNIIIFDLEVINNKIVAVYSMRSGRYSTDAYLRSFDISDKELVFDPEESLLIAKLDSAQRFFIKKLPSIDSLYIYSEGLDDFSFKGNIITSIYKIDGLKKPDVALRLIESVGESSTFLGVCNERLLFGKDKLKKKIRSLSLDLYETGKANPIKQEFLNSYDGPTVISLDAEFKKDKVLIYINYSKLENTRRKDGWYSWEGYDVLSFDGLCK